MSSFDPGKPEPRPSLVQQARGLAMYVFDDEPPAAADANRPFAQALAWSSYFVLAFVGQCVFNQPAMAAVITGTISTTGELIGLIDPARDMSALVQQLRGTI